MKFQVFLRKKFNLIKNIFLSNFKKLSSPYKVTFALTYRCNLRCKICNIWKTPYKRELEIREIEKIFKSLKRIGWLDLTGGEITLREDIIEVIKVIVRNTDNLLVFHISTNGQLPEKTFLLVKEVLKFNIIPIINISIDGPKRINDELRGIEGSYLRSLETFRLLKSFKKIYLYLSCTISDYNIDYIDEFISKLKKNIPRFAFSDLHFNVFHTSAHYYKNKNIKASSSLKFDNIKRYLDLTRGGNLVKKFLEDKYIKGFSQYLDGNKSPLKCQALQGSCFINPYGEVYPCGIYSRCVGNLKDYEWDLNKLWNSPEAFAVRRDIKGGKCPGCWTPCEAYPAILGSLGRNLLNF